MKSDSLSFHNLMLADCVFAACLCLCLVTVWCSLTVSVFLQLDFTSVCLLTVWCSVTVCLYLYVNSLMQCDCVSVCMLTVWCSVTVFLYLFTAWLCDDCVSVSVYSLTLWWLCVCICLQPDFVTSMFELSSGFTMLSLNDTEVGLFTGIILATNGKLLCLPPSWFMVKNRRITK